MAHLRIKSNRAGKVVNNSKKIKNLIYLSVINSILTLTIILKIFNII